MDYHVARNNQKLGVFPEADIRTRLQSGELLPNDLVWCEGMSAWRPAAEVFPEASTTPPPVPAAAPSFPATPRPTPVTLGPKPSNYLVPAILVTLFCCLPFGIASIVYASQVDTKYAAGDLAGAQKASDKAKLWMWLSLGGFLLLGVVYLGVMAFGIAMGGLAH